MKKMNKYLKVAFWVLLILGTFITTGFINHNLSEETCKEVVIDIQDARLYGFIDEGDITQILNNKFNTPISQKIKDIDTYAIESALNNELAIENSEVYISIDGKLIISLNQRIPILRVFSKKGSFYIDNKGKIMPTSKKFTAHVPVASGAIDLDYLTLMKYTNESEQESDSNLIPQLYSDLYKLAKYIRTNPFWEAQIEQLYVDKDSEFELIPRVGNHTIVLGGVYDLDSKFNKLRLFYEKGLSKTGWNEYKKINLKFKNQVVCTKRY